MVSEIDWEKKLKGNKENVKHECIVDREHVLFVEEPFLGPRPLDIYFDTASENPDQGNPELDDKAPTAG